ncbi:MAG TPA: hypothetical protein VK272_03035 [Solirubrobacteraceae bacterium]|nr:hypothetical protein [Solirubrobacteraceae bacterium]
MTGKIPTRLTIGFLGIVVAIVSLAIGASAASATSVVYNNFNTVPSVVNKFLDQDTYSTPPFEFPFGGMVEFTKRPGAIKSLITQVDSFTCEHGVYNLENCFTANPSKKFKYQLTASIYEVGTENEPVGPIATSTETFKIAFRPTTNVSCPATSEGKGFGGNCDVGGFLQTIKFKKFTPKAILPQRAIILITSTRADKPEDVVNVGVQTAYKEYDVTHEEFVAEPPLDGGIPEIGADPFPEGAYVLSKFAATGWAGFQPVFEVTATP